MIDWKVLASAFIALIVVSFILMEGFGVSGVFSNTLGSIGEWFGSSPFGNIVPTDSSSKHITVMLYPTNLTINPSGEVGIEAGGINMTGFSGYIQSDFMDMVLILKETDTKLEVAVPMRNVKITELRLEEFSMEDAKFMIAPNITTENGSIEMTDFFGSVTFSSGGMELDGNVSTLTAKIGELNLDLG